MPTARLALLAALLLSSGCASVLTGKVVNAADAAPVAGATVLIEPVSRLPSPGNRDLENTPVPSLSAELTCDAEGTFELRLLADESGGAAPLRPGWSYEVRAEALGFYTSVERVDLKGREAEVELRIHAIDEVAMDGQIIEGDAEKRHDGLQGKLIDEVLRRSGRVPGG